MIGLFFILAGANHFAHPEPYISMMPSYLPWPRLLVEISGVAEIVGGIGFMIPRLRFISAWGLIALLVAVFPANLNVAINGWPSVTIPQWVLWVRLPFQLLFIWWIYLLCNSGRRQHSP
ncbi:MAG: DoxX family protein [Verrucomicrobiota bacterium]|nr:DoxX family protein [Verrucomicrobiota bacterium]